MHFYTIFTTIIIAACAVTNHKAMTLSTSYYRRKYREYSALHLSSILVYSYRTKVFVFAVVKKFSKFKCRTNVCLTSYVDITDWLCTTIMYTSSTVFIYFLMGLNSSMVHFLAGKYSHVHTCSSSFLKSMQLLL